MCILVTGGAGFIGANFVHDWLAHSNETVVNLDKLTYAGNLETLSPLAGDPRHVFVHGDICDRPLVDGLLARYRPRAIVHFAAESHVDRSIHGPAEFIRTNIEGSFTLLESARIYWSASKGEIKEHFRFHHVSTDEVYGSLGPTDPPFTETHPFEPNSPYSASKAAADHLVRAWHHTYGLPVVLVARAEHLRWHIDGVAARLQRLDRRAGGDSAHHRDGDRAAAFVLRGGADLAEVAFDHIRGETASAIAETGGGLLASVDGALGQGGRRRHGKGRTGGE